MIQTDVSVDFLEQLRPGGPWVLSAIEPDGPITTITAEDAGAVRDFVQQHNGTRNLYYSVNPTRTAVSKKASKDDIAAIEYLLADLDPRKDESPDDAKVRYLEALQSFGAEPTALIDSGNGIQALWRPKVRIDLTRWKPEKAARIIEQIEARVAAAMVKLGGTAGTQNVDRILRLPGTTNIPNKAKKAAGRTTCPTALLFFNGATCKLRDFRIDADADEPAVGNINPGDEDKIEKLIHDKSIPVGKRSEAVWKVANAMLRQGYCPEAIVKVLLDRSNAISGHIYDQNNPTNYARRQVKQAIEKLQFTVDDTGRPHKNQNNIRIALLCLGVTLRYNEFSDQLMISGLADFGPVLDDGGLDRLWLLLDGRYKLKVSKDLLHTVIRDTAMRNKFHPVRDYLNSLKWDGVSRIDNWLTTYAGADDTPYTNAVGRLVLLAAVRRVRKPGCKFDEMLVLENPAQGTNKSSMLALMAVHNRWFSDDLPLSIDGKQVIEALRGRWIVEAAELAGMRRGEIEHIKALLSRTHDRARMAYARLVIDAPRQSIIVGTTNNSEYLRDLTGNRRFWPVRVGTFKLKQLRRDRDQLWAEAAALEAEGVSIRLAKELWPAAEAEQQLRLTTDRYYDVLQNALANYEGKITSNDV